MFDNAFLTATNVSVPLTTLQVSFYSVQLVCEAARHIGCGCKAKPRLAALDGQAAVLGTWLHQAGDLLAVEWQHALPADQRLALVRSAIGEVSELVEPSSLMLERVTSLGDPDRWYRRETIDRLSDQEARVIAKRVISRLSEPLSLPDSPALELELTEALRTVLVCDDDVSMEVRRDNLLGAAFAVVSEHLPTQERARLKALLTRETLLSDAADDENGSNSCCDGSVPVIRSNKRPSQ